MRKDLLGPDRTLWQPAPLRDELARVAAGLLAGARYLLRQRGPRAALGAIGGFGLMFGPVFLMAILLYRNYFYPSHATTAASHVGVLAAASAVGYACAALITPPATKRVSKEAWIALMLVGSAVATGLLGETFLQIPYLAIGFLLYLARQGMAISATTIIQEEVEDTYRGRVFSFYDMMGNTTYVAGAALFAAFMPADGKSPAIVAIVAVGFAIVAIAYWLAVGGSPSASAQRSSS
jgi:MFS-type transporter involved in bile tolerance (Atg22 family)